MSNTEGINIGEKCNRNGCDGTIYLYNSKDFDLGGCSCHINPPCSYCENSIEELRCNTCGWEEGAEDRAIQEEIEAYKFRIEHKYRDWIKDNLPKIDTTFVDINKDCEYKFSRATCVYGIYSGADLETLKSVYERDIDFNLIVLYFAPLKGYSLEISLRYGQYLRGILPSYLAEKANIESITAEKIRAVTDSEMQEELQKWENELQEIWGVAKYFDNHFDGWSCQNVNYATAESVLANRRKANKGYLTCYYIRRMDLPYKYTNSQ